MSCSCLRFISNHVKCYWNSLFFCFAEKIPLILRVFPFVAYHRIQISAWKCACTIHGCFYMRARNILQIICCYNAQHFSFTVFFSLPKPSWNVYKDFIWNLPFNLCVYLTKCTENSTQPTSVVTKNAHVHWDSNHSHACNWSESYEQICSYLRKQPQTRKIVLLHFIRAPVEEKKVNTNEWNIFHIIASLKLAKEYKTGQKLSHFCCCSLHEEKKTILACHFMRISKQLKKNRLNSINRFRYFSLSLSHFRWLWSLSPLAWERSSVLPAQQHMAN